MAIKGLLFETPTASEEVEDTIGMRANVAKHTVEHSVQEAE